ncbi:hypothetical protein PROFUN_15166 [Planoprotostelium fungivorum]|uniref:Uncharacterized protein n=1 Tax=Planoprotostelium fungivorum TaxID=1890364 RepID=A0A2P6MTW7_9EUKA|nr:hypothetical protein PROFUN_15166 [Planoprotostelium fungivorum]
MTAAPLKSTPTSGREEQSQAHAPSNEATTIKREVGPHLNNRHFISAPSHLEVPLHERNKKVPLPCPAQTSAEIQRATISENGVSDTQNRASS